jgi:hypothetical protein
MLSPGSKIYFHVADEIQQSSLILKVATKESTGDIYIQTRDTRHYIYHGTNRSGTAPPANTKAPRYSLEALGSNSLDRSFCYSNSAPEF